MLAHLNPNIFLLMDDTGIIVWNFERHTQYLLTQDYARRLLAIADTKSFDPHTDPIDADLNNEGLVSSHPFPATAWGWDILSRIYHLGTKNIPQEIDPKDHVEWSTHYIRTCEETIQREIPRLGRDTRNIIRLTTPDLINLEKCSLWQALSNRRTCRNFLPTAVSEENFSSILYASFGFLSHRERNINEFVPSELRQRRSSPSGGGLNASEVYIWCRRVELIAPGIYHYNPHDHTLGRLNDPEETASLPSLLMGQYFSEDLAFGVFITCRFDRMWWKYGHSRAYRVSLLDIGHLSQTFQLAATAAGLGTWISAAFKDSAVEKLLNINTPGEQVLLFVGAGYSNGEDLDIASRNLLCQR